MLNCCWEVPLFLANFETYANWDGEKYYITFKTVHPKGTLTIMKTADGKFFYHRQNEFYWDIKEIMIDLEFLYEIVWAFRVEIMRSIKEMVV